MILGRPVAQWTGLIAASLALVQVLIVNLRPDLDPATVATILGALGAFLGVFIAFLAGQPPTVTTGSVIKAETGDVIKVETPAGQPNTTVTV